LALVYQQGGAVVDAAKTRYKSVGDKLTVGQCVTEYLSKHELIVRPATITLYKYTLEKNLKRILSVSVESVRYDEWLRLLDNIRAETSANSAFQVLKIAKRCFGWCLKREIIENCHVLRISVPEIAAVPLAIQSQRCNILPLVRSSERSAIIFKVA
jgi:hypothetical protein